MSDAFLILSLASQRSEHHSFWWPVLVVIGAGALLARSWLARAKARVAPLTRPLNVDRLMAIMYPEMIRHEHGLPNIETLMPPKVRPPTEKVPHVPAICRECETMDWLPEDGNRPTKMHWSGLCLECWALTPEGMAELESEAAA